MPGATPEQKSPCQVVPSIRNSICEYSAFCTHPAPIRFPSPVSTAWPGQAPRSPGRSQFTRCAGTAAKTGLRERRFPLVISGARASRGCDFCQTNPFSTKYPILSVKLIHLRRPGPGVRFSRVGMTATRVIQTNSNQILWAPTECGNPSVIATHPGRLPATGLLFQKILKKVPAKLIEPDYLLRSSPP